MDSTDDDLELVAVGRRRRDGDNEAAAEALERWKDVVQQPGEMATERVRASITHENTLWKICCMPPEKRRKFQTERFTQTSKVRWAGVARCPLFG